MHSDRVLLTRLQLERKSIDVKIEKLTHHPTGVSYSKMLCSLIEGYIDKNCSFNNKSERYKLYEKIRGSISKEVGVNSNSYTRSEYLDAIEVLKTKYDYDAPEAYKL